MNAEELATKIRTHLASGTPSATDWHEYVAAFKALGELERIDCWSRLTAGNSVGGQPPPVGTPEWDENLRIAKAVHPYLCDALLEVFKMPRGEAGKGVVPYIPPGLKRDP